MSENTDNTEDVATSDSSEYGFSEMDLDTLARPRSTDFASATNHSLRVPTRKPDVRSQRVYADGPEVTTAETVSEVGAGAFSANTITVFPRGQAGTVNPAQILLGDDSRRQRIVVSNGHSSDSVLIGRRHDVENGGGFSLPSGTVIEISVTSGLFAAIPANGTNPVPVGVWSEYA